METNPVLVEVERSGFVESWHRGAVIGFAAGGTETVRAGNPGVPIFPRSANKPMQAVAMLRCGLDLDGELLALAAGSHSGEDFHVEGTEKILAGAGLVADDLRCPESWPIDPETQQDVARNGGGASRLRMNCSGKHAAMLATCVTAGWPTASYLDADHPLQLAVRDAVENMAGEPVTAVGVDGCGAPLFAVSTAGVARAFRALVLAEPGTPERRVADAMRTHPQWTSGTRREERQLMNAVPGLLVKCGAEGVDAFAFTDGRAGAVKIDDGAMRARTPVTVALLRSLGVHEVADADQRVLDELSIVEVRGGHGVVGAIRPAPDVFTT